MTNKVKINLEMTATLNEGLLISKQLLPSLTANFIYLKAQIIRPATAGNSAAVVQGSNLKLVFRTYACENEV